MEALKKGGEVASNLLLPVPCSSDLGVSEARVLIGGRCLLLVKEKKKKKTTTTNRRRSSRNSYI